MGRKTIGLLEALASATQEDLDDLTAQIEAAETELRTLVAAARNKIESLRACAKVLAVRLHGPVTRAPRGSGAESARQPLDKAPVKQYSELATAIYDLLVAEGSPPVPAIAARLGRAAAGVGKCVSSCEWFARTAGGEVAIAKAGDA